MYEAVNRRKSVRFTDRVLLSVNPVPPEKLQTITEDFHNGISVYSQEELVEIQMFIGAQSSLAKLREKNEDLADFLQHLDNKMSLLLRQFQSNKSPLDDLIMQKANLSADGIAYNSVTPAKIGDTLEIHIVFLPGYSYVYCFGKVVSCNTIAVDETENNNQYKIALEYTLLMEDDREKIIQHNFKQQNLALRNRRLTS
ncbi:MAG: PilZ domain-containing protein [Proteobacteria bacterium]|nr:PilZ domain-containing protein [Desulfobulbaceae bacterium]MBU4152053.1 PilZ domain-containing protein [Pseudomonadota bacterium]